MMLRSLNSFRRLVSSKSCAYRLNLRCLSSSVPTDDDLIRLGVNPRTVSEEARKWYAAEPSHVPFKNANAWKEQGGTARLQNFASHHGVFEDVIPPFEPSVYLQVSYDSSAVHFGNTLAAKDTQVAPKVSFDAEEKDALYTLIMTDPDAPMRSEPTFAEWHHWMVTNIPGDGLDISKGDTWKEYIGCGPPRGTGLHRYVFLLCRQEQAGSLAMPGDFKVLSSSSGEDRGGQSTMQLLSTLQLQPVGLAFFQAEWDEAVTKLYTEQLGMEEEPDFTEKDPVAEPRDGKYTL
jgi:phosphatidylethanolamine-binding protein